MSKRSVLLACIVMILGIVWVPAVWAETIIPASQSCRTDILNPDANRHDASKLSVRSDASSAKSWIKFDLGDLDVSALGTATLTVTLHEPKTGDRNFDVSYVNDDCLDNIDWDERSLTWNNAPGNSTADLGGLDASKTTLVATVHFTDGVAGDAFTIDILDVLETDTDGIVQFVLHNSNGLLNFATWDHATEAWRPFITVTEGSRTKAKKPYPAKDATDVPYDVLLAWTPGAYAPAVNGHNVYFSDSFDDVNDGVALVSPGQDANSYDPGRLEFGVTYYWRVDEANSVTGWEPGDIWSFTTEPFAYPVTGVNVTASIPTVAGVEQGPGHTADGSGLIDGRHSTAESDMWLGDATAGGPVWLRYDFDRVYKLYDVHVWNHNNAYEMAIGFGAKSVTIEYATDADDWTVLGDFEIARAPGLDTYTGMTIDLGGIAAKSVRININSNWGGQPQ
ncbi:MAG: DNRLRE domain-containing protein, partial [Sedimentisphaerales bacterium]|nr:DNRLRE domain-containing protein [Sedimentisphaerales bacterium]